uniref:hypothetical protein n=1 Tax=Rothia sp. RSM42 TaxID=3030211 RepID=UPI002446C633
MIDNLLEWTLVFFQIVFQLIPFVLPALWIFGAFVFYFTKERKQTVATDFSQKSYSILIPCYNEQN